MNIIEIVLLTQKVKKKIQSKDPFEVSDKQILLMKPDKFSQKLVAVSRAQDRFLIFGDRNILNKNAKKLPSGLLTNY